MYTLRTYDSLDVIIVILLLYEDYCRAVGENKKLSINFNHIKT